VTAVAVGHQLPWGERWAGRAPQSESEVVWQARLDEDLQCPAARVRDLDAVEVVRPDRPRSERDLLPRSQDQQARRARP
jgi:hypothetical protein